MESINVPDAPIDTINDKYLSPVLAITPVYDFSCKDLYEPKDNSAAERYKNIIILLSIFVEIKLNKLDELSYKPENTRIEIPIDK